MIGKSIPQKIDVLSELVDTDNHEIISEIIKMLDDTEIQVRGEAFSTLVLNPKNISDILINHLESDSKNLRGFTILVLANRNDKTATKEIAKFTNVSKSYEMENLNLIIGLSLVSIGILFVILAIPLLLFSDNSNFPVTNTGFNTRCCSNISLCEPSLD